MAKFDDEPRLPTLIRLILKFIIGWLISFVRFIIALCNRCREKCRKKRRHKWEKPCHTYPSDLWIRPDVYIYSQSWLRSQGMSVTWNNPDIELRFGNNPVDSYHLDPDKEYTVIANIHNRSISSPAIGVKVDFYVRSFGINAATTHIGQTSVDISVVGGSLNPAPATIKWKTPTQAGHYCMVVRLNPPDDVNWADNEGQENMNVIDVTPGDPDFEIPVWNDKEEDIKIKLELDSYKIPDKSLSPGLPEADIKKHALPEKKIIMRGDWLFGSKDPNFLAKQLQLVREWKEKRNKEVVTANALGKFPVPENMNAAIPKEINIPPKSSKNIPFSFKVPDDAQEGEEFIFNITGLNGKGNLVGGVTILAKVKRP